jgi:hypothetical protein
MPHQRKPPSLTLKQLWKSRGSIRQTEDSGVVPAVSQQPQPELPAKREHSLPPFRPERSSKPELTLPPYKSDLTTKRESSLPPRNPRTDLSPTRTPESTPADSRKVALDDRPFTALLAVIAALCLLFEGGRAVYRAFSDAWISPIVVSPDSDLVLSHRLSLSHLTDERDLLHIQLESDTARLAADNLAAERLRVLELSLGRMPDWLSQSASALSAAGTPSGLSPERAAQHAQQVKIELERVEFQAETRALTAQLANARHREAQLDELIAQVRARPVFQALASIERTEGTEAKQDIAFVARSQLVGVSVGASVLQCSLLGLFFCNKVGSVAELLFSEVTVHDAWGAPNYGQYAVLRLTDPSAARARVLHVRPADEPLSHLR